MKPIHNDPASACGCGAAGANTSLIGPEFPGVTRRQFLYRVGATAAGGLALPKLLVEEASAAQNEAPPPHRRLPLRIQPVLTYEVPRRREATSWRNWGGIQTEAQAQQERERIDRELGVLKAKADYPIEILPVQAVRTIQPASHLAHDGNYDVLLIFAAGGGADLLQALTLKDKWQLMFLRHSPGPVYLWYEIVHPRFLRKTVDVFSQAGWGVHDVVTDDYDLLSRRLRSLAALKNTLGKRIVCVGGASGWGEGGRRAPDIARTLWKLDLVDYPYAELGPRLKAARQDSGLRKRAQADARRYLGQAGTTLETNRSFVDNAFVLLTVLKDLMAEAQTDAITVNACMGTIIPMAQTTACLPLSLLNDDGYSAFCESDFVVIPAGLLLHAISGKPVFLNDPTYPHAGIVTLAHCTAPRRMDGRTLAPARILTHFESDYGAAPKVAMRLNQRVTTLVPDFACRNWVGFNGTIVANPFLAICRSQIDVRIEGDSERLLAEMKGFHWMLGYGSHLPECAYALGKLGIELLNVSETPAA